VNPGAVITCSSGNQLDHLVEIASLPNSEFHVSQDRWETAGEPIGDVMEDGWTRYCHFFSASDAS
jgi:hypothetical protein